jgi:hypothetical protein
MSTIQLVDPELRDALALAPQVPLTAETLTGRRADALALLSSVLKPDLPDIVTGEIHARVRLARNRSGFSLIARSGPTIRFPSLYTSMVGAS